MTRVLIVDDDQWLASVFVRQLERSQIEARVAPNAVEAIKVIDEFRPDVLILDIFMPGPNGLVLLHELQSHSDLAKLPVVVCTASAREVDIDKLRPYGVLMVLDKVEMQPSDVTAAVRKVL